MKKRLLTLVTPLLLLLLVFVPQSAQAKIQAPHIPSSYDCFNNLCEGVLDWSGNTHGAFTKMTASNPTLNNSNGDWFRYVSVTNGIPNIYAVQLGMEKFRGNGATFCGQYASQTAYFFYRVLLNGATQTSNCANIPSADFNTDVSFRIGYFTSNGGGMFVQILDNSGQGGMFNRMFLWGHRSNLSKHCVHRRYSR